MSKQKIYPFAVAAVRCMENNLIKKDKLMQMAEAPTAEDVLHMLAECGYGELPREQIHDFEKLLSEQLNKAYKSLAGLIPANNSGSSGSLTDVFLYKNDYQNMKVLIKQEVSGIDVSAYFIDGGTIPLEKLKTAFLERKFSDLPAIKADAVNDALETYAKTHDGRYIDVIMDNACFQTMAETAKATGNSYVIEYVKKLADITNIKTFVRIKRLGKNWKLFDEAYVDGGSISKEKFNECFQNDNPSAMLAETGYKQITENCMTTGFTEFERMCDDYLMSYVKDAKYKTLTPEPLVGYILGKETEIKCVRIIMTCKLNNIDSETIKERVREAYV